MEIDLNKIKKVFFVGIGGIGISALAKMVISRGIEVSGVNDEESPKTLEPLRELGAEIFLQKNFSVLPEADLYIYSDAWIYRGPEILENAKATGKPVLSYFEALGEFAKAYKVIAISGTHGKTTTTAMVADIMVDAGLDPTVIVGSFVKKFGSNFRKGESEYLVVEADEYNRHMLNFHPFISVITNIEADHLDCYKDLADIQEAFDIFISQSQNHIKDYSKYLEKVPKLAVLGEHNRMNAASALAVADMLGINLEEAGKTLASFSGTWRRLEKKGVTETGTIVYDDYAHHPTEIRASLQALREIYPKGSKKITVLFQPHLYSRTKALFKEFSESFGLADEVLLLPIYFAREAPDPEVSSGILAEAINKNGQSVLAFDSFELAEAYVSGNTFSKDDIFVTMGAGEAYKVAEKCLKLV
ncbi:MAG: Mur ligase family protein [Candidatus Nomurabacteria bacterium]|nr:Mur ligase family protein [Candidatus Nomurabacteria bacterium]